LNQCIKMRGLNIPIVRVQLSSASKLFIPTS
jgi:hypothetical protein